MVQSAAPSSPTSHQERMLLLGLGLATGMEFYVADSMNLVLVDLTGTLGVSLDQASWILTTYSLALFLGVPVSGWMAGHFGPKRYLIGSVALFAMASVGCMISPGLETLLICRVVQGFAASALITWWRSTIYIVLPRPHRSGNMMRASILLSLSSATGLIVSGLIAEYLNWRLIFVPALLFALGAIWLLARYYPPCPPFTSERLRTSDWQGMILLMVAVASLQILLSRGEIDDWFASSHIRTLALLGVGALVLFLLWQLHPRNRNPLLLLTVLRDRLVLSAAALGIFTGMILSGSLFVLPEFLRGAASQTLSASQAGRLMAAYAVAAAVVRSVSGQLLSRTGQRKALAIAMILLSVSMLLLNRLMTADTPAAYYMPALILYGACQAIFLPSVGSGTMSRVSDEKFLDGVTLYMTFRQFGASLGVALLTILLERRETLHSSRLYEALRAGQGTTEQWMRVGAQTLAGRDGFTPHRAQEGALDLLAHAGWQQVETLSYADAFTFMAVIAVITLFVIPLMPPTPVVKK
ncbi:DHA2 family efflux MFS transporter permease subunit [Nguyenibacter vanlangensis]|uniref:DHA2 family efflux MFS transporter permease subunit n=1 Tax=Nguyenibacter vanlangensis TaxID=1216886 RepID=A0ABZ3D9Y8_9PROT